jgi:hypothetical protein
MTVAVGITTQTFTTVDNFKDYAFNIAWFIDRQDTLVVTIDDVVDAAPDISWVGDVSDGVSDGGIYRFATNPGNGKVLKITRKTVIEQDSDFSGTKFPAEDVEQTFDKQTMIMQELSPQLNGIAEWTPKIIGTPTNPVEITAADGIKYDGSRDTTIYVKGSGGAVVVSANPQITNTSTLYPSSIGDRLTIIGTDNVNTVELVDGNGNDQNDSFKLGQGRMISYIFNGTLQEENSRNR